MTVRTGPWHVRLTSAAETDFAQIQRWTADQFGDAQSEIYSETVTVTLDSLREQGTRAIGVKQRDDLGKGVWTLHVAHHGRRGRHFLAFRIEAGSREKNIQVLRILHDSMDLKRHLADDDPA